jgi:hypothetical protein
MQAVSKKILTASRPAIVRSGGLQDFIAPWMI